MIFFFAAVLFIAMQGFFAGMETGMVSIMRPRAEHAVFSSGKRSARIILFFLNRPEIMIATTLIGVNICVVCASLSVKQFLDYCGIVGRTGMWTSGAILSIVLLSCEIIPKNWFRQAPFERCSHFVWILYCVYCILYLPVRLFAGFTHFLSTTFAKKQEASAQAVVREDLRLFLRESEGHGSLDSETARILDKAMALPNLIVQDIMKKKIDVLEIPSSTSIRQAFQFANSHQIETLPVFLADPESDMPSEQHHWCAIFDVYDAMYSIPEPFWDRLTVASCLGSLFPIQANDTISTALELSRENHVALFGVVDQNGRQIGVLSPDTVAALLFE